MTKKENYVNIEDMKESLAQIVASYTYIADNLGYLKETDVVMRFTLSMLDAQNKLDIPLDKKGTTYRKLFKQLRRKWAAALKLWSAKSGEWRESWVACTDVLDTVLRIATKEGLLKMNASMYNLSRGPMVDGMQASTQLPMMDGEEQ